MIFTILPLSLNKARANTDSKQTKLEYINLEHIICKKEIAYIINAASPLGCSA